MPRVKLEVTKARTEDLKEYENNVKAHEWLQVQQIANSIEEFGFNDPIGVWHNQSGELEIVEGHGRLLAARELGLEEVPIVVLDHLTDEQRRAYAIVHNKITMDTGFDPEKILADMDELDFDFEGLGFNAIELAAQRSAEDAFVPFESDYEDVTLPFADNAQIADYARTAVKALYSQGIIGGKEKNGKLYFDPSGSLTRAQAAAMIGRTPEKGYAEVSLTFADAAALPAYAAPYIRTMAAQGVIGGYTDGTFKPANNITRGQMAKILFNLR